MLGGGCFSSCRLLHVVETLVLSCSKIEEVRALGYGGRRQMRFQGKGIDCSLRGRNPLSLHILRFMHVENLCLQDRLVLLQ